MIIILYTSKHLVGRLHFQYFEKFPKVSSENVDILKWITGESLFCKFNLFNKTKILFYFCKTWSPYTEANFVLVLACILDVNEPVNVLLFAIAGRFL